MAAASPEPEHRGAPPTVAVASPEPDHLPIALGDNATDVARYPHHPVDPSQTLSSNWVVALITAKPPVDQEKSMAPAKAASLNVVPPAPLAVPPLPEKLPTGSALHLWIVYRPSDAGEGARVDALTNQLRTQNSDITSATVSAGPAPKESVVYFFPDDRAGASRIAASLSRMTRRAEPVMLVHANRLPRPGTIEIRLPLKVGKDLNNEGS